VTADNYPITYVYLASERYAIDDDAVATYNAVVTYVSVSHNEVVRADDGGASRSSTATDGYALANLAVVANNGC
jgi:hypothetical protein